MNPAAEWKQPAITTHLKGNHAISTESWRYIRYADGTEELYDVKSDPNEWTNLAGKPELAAVTQELGAYIPKAEAEPVERREAPRPARRNRQATQAD